jgi:hypothetical protein
VDGSMRPFVPLSEHKRIVRESGGKRGTSKGSAKVAAAAALRERCWTVSVCVCIYFVGLFSPLTARLS